jgi:endonuclease YncB( thermonuclease family)
MTSYAGYGRFGLALMLLSLVALGGAQTVHEGRVIAVDDGDTLTVLTRTGARLRIRLAEIDAPELAQRYGQRARQSLAHLTLQRPVRIVEQTKDRYGRIVGRVYVGELDVSAELLRLGMAWSYRQYAQDPALYPLEQQARAARQGLWVDARPIPPWTFRHGETPSGRARHRPGSSLHTGGRHRCFQSNALWD